jgi:glycosyltransferase involved in cell wall biosynthesis
MRRVARIGFDGLMISPHGKGHARSERYAVEAMRDRGGHDLVVFVRDDVVLEGVEVVRVAERLTLDWELRGLQRAARRHRLDAFVSLSERLPPRPVVPVVVWLFESPVHRIRANRAAKAPLRHRWSDVVTQAWWKRSLRRAAHVAFGSEATRSEVLRAVPLDATSVVHPGVPPGFSPAEPGADGGYAFHLGSNDPRDGTAVAVEACRRARVRLVVAGGWRGEGADARGRVSDAELLELYRHAAVYVDPTRYEGFGYGILEAMACGAPVVASGVTSVPEVLGDAGLLCDPADIDAFAAAVAELAADPQRRAQLRARGLARAATFAWTRTADGLLGAVESVL